MAAACRHWVTRSAVSCRTASSSRYMLCKVRAWWCESLSLFSTCFHAISEWTLGSILMQSSCGSAKNNSKLLWQQHLTGQFCRCRHGCRIMLLASAPTNLLLDCPKQPNDRLQRARVLLSSLEGILHLDWHGRRRGQRRWSLQKSGVQVTS